MRILAVIPARASSKGIPNKNIRIVGGYPLVYYAIDHAKRSKYITDIVVTTDSPEVRIIARQMGTACRWRDARLCGDEVTLDSVVADAIPDGIPWDYIVTLQPTSPTLKVETLDAAISYTIEKNLDTLISAKNAPHLSWGIKDGKMAPNYLERVNRQYLPPHYVETGAFLISKASVVTPETRIGEKMDIFEMPENESLDVDSFLDLHAAATILTEKRVAIYVNGNNTRGMGHIYRSLELADEFFVKPDIFYDINQTDPAAFGKTTHSLLPVNGIAELFEKCRENQYAIFINDILDTSVDYMIGLRSVLPDAKIVNFEDKGEGSAKADIVFNALYQESKLPKVYAGEKYYISNKLFMFFRPIEIREFVTRVFISFGGADPQNYSERLLKIISKPAYQKYHFLMVLGRAKRETEELMRYNEYPNIEVLHDVSNMPELMSSCDIAVTSRGRTGHELAILGIPAITMAQNQGEEQHGFMCGENGFTDLGLNPPEETIENALKTYLSLSREDRQFFQNAMLKHDLRSGRKRVMTLINNL